MDKMDKMKGVEGPFIDSVPLCRVRSQYDNEYRPKLDHIGM